MVEQRQALGRHVHDGAQHGGGAALEALICQQRHIRAAMRVGHRARQCKKLHGHAADPGAGGRREMCRLGEFEVERRGGAQGVLPGVAHQREILVGPHSLCHRYFALQRLQHPAEDVPQQRLREERPDLQRRRRRRRQGWPAASVHGGPAATHRAGAHLAGPVASKLGQRRVVGMVLEHQALQGVVYCGLLHGPDRRAASCAIRRPPPAVCSFAMAFLGLARRCFLWAGVIRLIMLLLAASDGTA